MAHSALSVAKPASLFFIKSMTQINITIQERNGRLTITNLSQHGDELPNDMWENINVAIANAVEKGGEQ